MEIVARNDLPVNSENAALLEREGQLEAAALMYEKLLKISTALLPLLARLMIIYRKLKKYKKEIAAIDKAIKIQEQKYTGRKKSSVNVVALSKKLNSVLGHTDRKGNSLLLIDEVEKLKSRRKIAVKKMDKDQKPKK